MSAFEIVGVVLAVLPLILEGLDAYPESKLVKFARANQERREFARQLMSVQSGLRYSMEGLFMRMEAKLTADQWRDFGMCDVKGSKFFHVWNEVLKANPDMIKTNTFAEVKFVLDDIVMVLTKVVEDTGIPVDAGLDSLRSIIENHKQDKTFSFTKGLFKRFMFARKDRNRSRLIKRMEDNIAWINRLNQEQDLMKTVAPPRNILERQESHIKFLDKVRDSGDNLYDALSSLWQCECHNSPSAMLRLEKRKELKGPSGLWFSLFLTYEHSSASSQDTWAFQETEICVDQK